MSLLDIENPSKIMSRAISQGIKTLDEYSIWLKGYELGYRIRQGEVLEVVEEGFEEPFPLYAEEVIKQEKDKDNEKTTKRD